MKTLIKNTAFALLAVACMGAAFLLFRPEAGRVTPEPDTSSSPASTETAPRDPSPAGRVDMIGDWNTYHGGHALQGVAEVSLPDDLQVLWRVPAGAAVRLSPVVSQGRVFAVTAQAEVLAVSKDGKVLWRRKISEAGVKTDSSGRVYVDAPIAVFEDRVFIGTDMGSLAALHADTGETLWTADIGGPLRGTPNYLPDTDRLFVLDQDTGEINCLDIATGARQWRAQGVDRADGSPAVSDGVVVFGSCASAVHIISSENGEHLHDVRIENGGGQVAGGVALADGHVYAGCRDGRIMRANIQSGEMIWIHPISEDEVFSTPAVWGDRVIVTSFDGVVHALDRETGDVVWQYESGGMPASPIIAGDRVIITADGTLFLLNLDDGALVLKKALADEITGAAVLSDMIVVGSEDGTLIALGRH